MGEEIDPIELLLQLVAASGDEDVLGVQKDAANFQQDQFDLLGIPGIEALAGPGSFDPRSFADVADGFEEFELPDDELAAYRSLSPESIEGLILFAIEQGSSPDEAVQGAIDKQLIDNPDAEKRARELASDMFSKQSSFESGMRNVPGAFRNDEGRWEYDGDGEVVGNKLRVAKFRPSDAAQEYLDRGLPSPTDQYGLSDFGYDREGDARKNDALFERVLGARQAVKDDDQVRGVEGRVDQVYRALIDRSFDDFGSPSQRRNSATTVDFNPADQSAVDELASARYGQDAPSRRVSAGSDGGVSDDARSRMLQTLGSRTDRQNSPARQANASAVRDVFSARLKSAVSRDRARTAKRGHNTSPLQDAMLTRAYGLRGLSG